MVVSCLSIILQIFFIAVSSISFFLQACQSFFCSLVGLIWFIMTPINKSNLWVNKDIIKIGVVNQMSKVNKMKMVGEKFIKDTLEYRNVHPRKRKQQLKSIMKIPKSKHQFQDIFPPYPIQYPWPHGDNMLAAYQWVPKTKPQALLINFHALNAHTGLSGRMASVLAESGIVTAGFDYPNFGNSVLNQKKRGCITDVNQLVKISEDFILHSRIKYPRLPIFVFGLSMGGLIAFQTAILRNKILTGCILVNPAFEDNPINNPYLKKLMMLMGIFSLHFRTMKPIRSHSTKFILQNYKKHDKLMYTGKVWTSTTWAMLSNMYQCRHKYSQLETPYLCIQGGSDKVLNPFAVFELQKQSKSRDKETVIIHDLWHAMWFDENQKEVINMTKKWILNRI